MNRRSFIRFGCWDFKIFSKEMKGCWDELAENWGKCPHCGDSVSLCMAKIWPVRVEERKVMLKNFEKNAGYYFLFCKNTCRKLVGKATTLEALYEQA